MSASTFRLPDGRIWLRVAKAGRSHPLALAVFGPSPAFDASFVFRYQDRETGEIRDTNAVAQRCATPA